MHLPRRNFIKTGTLTALGAGIALNSGNLALGEKLLSSFESANPPKGFSFTKETFQSLLGDTFKAPNWRGQLVNLKLIDVSSYQKAPRTKIATKVARQPNSFSITFSANERISQNTSIHKLRHDALGEFNLFLTRREAKKGVLLYDAVFSHV
ncbi:MAG TPA: hypothetical protein VJU86_07680 [Pyrinomonadaceae bacterium]|nr:hypothetical protein [Pyrinomonadaceae bacterium]